MENIFCYCFQCFSTAKILQRHVNDCFVINGKQVLKTAEKGGTGKCKHYARKTKYSFII